MPSLRCLVVECYRCTLNFDVYFITVESTTHNCTCNISSALFRLFENLTARMFYLNKSGGCLQLSLSPFNFLWVGGAEGEDCTRERPNDHGVRKGESSGVPIRAMRRAVYRVEGSIFIQATGASLACAQTCYAWAFSLLIRLQHSPIQGIENRAEANGRKRLPPMTQVPLAIKDLRAAALCAATSLLDGRA